MADVGEGPSLKLALDANGRSHLTALLNKHYLVLRLTADNKTLGELKIPLLAELAAFFRDLAVILKTSSQAQTS